MNRYIMRMLALRQQRCQQTEEEVQEEEHKDKSFAEELMDSKEFKNYISHNGYHFSDRLAEWASSLLHNKDQSKHRWSVESIKIAVLPQLSVSVLHGSWGDLTYSANYAYAVYYPTVIKDEAGCIKYAIQTDTDENNRASSVFNHFVSDVIEKNLIVPWGEVI